MTTILCTVNGREETIEAPTDEASPRRPPRRPAPHRSQGGLRRRRVRGLRCPDERRSINSCLVPILQAEGAEITTIEGLAIDEKLHPIQQCFLEEGGAQCGICTPGMILATHHLLEKHPQPTLSQIQEGLNGNLCRCTGYMRIFNAVQQAAPAGVEE